MRYLNELFDFDRLFFSRYDIKMSSAKDIKKTDNFINSWFTFEIFYFEYSYQVLDSVSLFYNINVLKIEINFGNI